MSFQEPRKRVNGVHEDAVSKRAKTGGFRINPLCVDKGFGRTNDEIHSSINFCPVMKAIMDTKQMQRLRGLRQLGAAEHTYMNGNHNRFEHSVGVGHLAERLCEHLKKRQPNLGITDKDVLCVKLAGLCHDLGHGPFSHVYDEKFPKRLAKHLEANPELQQLYNDYPQVPVGWKHEEASLMMIDAALADLGLEIDMENLDAPLKQIGDGIDAVSMRVYHQWEVPQNDDSKPRSTKDVLTSRDWVFIKECIIGRPICTKLALKNDESGFVGRPLRSKEFLYDIVANRHTGLDVDKIDYYARDQRRSNRDAGEIEFRMIEEAVVAWGECSRPEKCFRCYRNESNPEKHLMICYPEKMVEHATSFFCKRFELHSKIYAHKTSVAATLMVCDILTLADPYFPIPTFLDDDDDQPSRGDGEKPSFLPISRAMLDKVAYFRLRDSVVDQILATTKPELKEARKLILRLAKRDLYKCAATIKIDIDNRTERAIWDKDEQQLLNDILLLDGEHRDDEGRTFSLEEGDVIVVKDDLHHGAGDDNPLSRMRFLPKRDLRHLAGGSANDLPEAKIVNPEKHKSHTKMAWKERMIRFYCRDSGAKVDLLRHVFELWESEVREECQQTVVSEEYEAGSSGYDVPVPLTQDSETMSPVKSETDFYFADESPIPSRSFRDA